MAGPTIAAIKKVLEGIIVPEMQVVKDRLASIEGELRAVHSEIKRLDDKIENGLASVRSEVARIDEKLTFTNKRLDEALDIRERLAALEARVGH